ncbi:protein translocase subunit [Lobaria immixta]|nr:protein translocase subunit [Lobaria immixta]
MNAINNHMDLASSSEQKATIIREIQKEAAVANARQLIHKLNSHCFEKCIPSPGSSLSKKEESCFTQCMEKYMATWNTVSRQYISRIQRSNQGVGDFPGL